MRRQKRPFFTPVVFATLLIFILFLAWQSNAFRRQMEQARHAAQGRTLFLPLAGDIPCTGRGCPGSPYPAPAYPALEDPGPGTGFSLQNISPQSAQRERTQKRISLRSPWPPW